MNGFYTSADIRPAQVLGICSRSGREQAERVLAALARLAGVAYSLSSASDAEVLIDPEVVLCVILDVDAHERTTLVQRAIDAATTHAIPVVVCCDGAEEWPSAEQSLLFDWMAVGEHRLERALGRAAQLSRARRRGEESRRGWLDVNARMAAFADSVPGVAFQFRWEGTGLLRFLFAAGMPEQLLGVSASALEGDAELFWRLLHPDERGGFAMALAQSARAGARLNWEGRVRIASGDEKWINLRGTTRAGEDARLLWEGVMLNITQGKRNEHKLRESRQRLAELSTHLQFAKEEERERIAREIHDVLGGHLVALKFEASFLASAAGQDSRLGARVRSIGDLLDEAIDVVGRVTRELRPGILRDFGLAAALEAHAEDFTRRTKIVCHVFCDDDLPDLPEPVAVALFRIFQEALTNVLKHAHAGHIEATLGYSVGEVWLQVCDDGKGILAADLEKPRSFGLRGMQERALSLGGRFEILPLAPQGTRLQVTLPVEGMRIGEGEKDE